MRDYYSNPEVCPVCEGKAEECLERIGPGMPEELKRDPEKARRAALMFCIPSKYWFYCRRCKNRIGREDFDRYEYFKMNRF